VKNELADLILQRSNGYISIANAIVLSKQIRRIIFGSDVVDGPYQGINEVVRSVANCGIRIKRPNVVICFLHNPNQQG
jgi:hypothetical protein